MATNTTEHSALKQLINLRLWRNFLDEAVIKVWRGLGQSAKQCDDNGKSGNKSTAVIQFKMHAAGNPVIHV